MKAWLERHAVALLAVLVVVVMVLTAVVVVQAFMLVSHGWTVPLGNVAEGVGAASTFAAFGALLLAIREWRAVQAARRDEEANQARLVIVEPQGDPRSANYQVVICNRSQFPVVNVRFDMTGTAQRMNESRSGPLREKPGAFWGLGRVGETVLLPGETFGPLEVDWGSEPTTPPTPPVITERHHRTFPDDVVFTFTDVQGRNWKRVGAGQPTRVDATREG